MSWEFLHVFYFQELYHYVAESLGETFPEIVKNEKKIKMMLDFEEESYKKLLTNSKTDQLRRDFPIQAKSIYTMEANRFYNSLQLLGKHIYKIIILNATNIT